jgi:hypothetical protein
MTLAMSRELISSNMRFIHAEPGAASMGPSSITPAR